MRFIEIEEGIVPLEKNVALITLSERKIIADIRLVGAGDMVGHEIDEHP